jgi:hypothetical protein
MRELLIPILEGQLQVLEGEIERLESIVDKGADDWRRISCLYENKIAILTKLIGMKLRMTIEAMRREVEEIKFMMQGGANVKGNGKE